MKCKNTPDAQAAIAKKCTGYLRAHHVRTVIKNQVESCSVFRGIVKEVLRRNLMEFHSVFQPEPLQLKQTNVSKVVLVWVEHDVTMLN